ncbi:sensor histidine kinase [Actinotignum sanguinis]|uniref:Signal transduction histidine-protein kinase/phosphatase MprB n=1 Tax=Actinotignum sanguinis TaxID=1445614 RepID=A0ABT5V7V9_9ACTO|nr:HAMP domain-containing sensor histidine kinase [Actinotignum sanguinis]MDE1656057.1 HAMP domain-containing sensor histidine kinase [Actinotignum sanguinis]
MRARSLRMTIRTALAAILLVGIPALIMGGVTIPRNALDEGRARRDMVLFLGAEILAIIVAILVAVGIAMRVSRRISAPLIYLAAAAEQLGAGTTRPQMAPSGIEEIDLVFEEIARAADRMAGRLSAERQFAADASHQLRTPLTSLSMRLEEIQYLSDDPDVKEEATRCLEQVERLTGVVTDLLHASRAQESATEAVALQPIFTQQGVEWERAFAAAGRKVVFTVGEHGPVLSDPGALSQIIATCVENSLKYGAGTTTVTSRPAGRGVIIDISDEGEGVAPEFVEAIFTQGFSLGGSTGFGLPLARQLAERNGGRLELSQARPPIFSVVLAALPAALDPAKVFPAGGEISVGARRRRF